ncbi:MAG: MarR family transcriptional regulator [Candidatus Aenigmarchaeota archaeon]|nr:MarR family transcriptional regulator [Candidatus Aenigmarchaeota archaeon]
MTRINFGNRQIGLIVILFAAAFALIVLDFTRKVESLNAVLHQNCTLPDAICPFVGTPHQALVGFAITGLLFLFGILLVFMSRKEVAAELETKEKTEKLVKELGKDEQKLYETVRSAGAVFQSELVEKTGFTKVRVTRILDKLEAKGLVERKRRGMTNIVTAKR